MGVIKPSSLTCLIVCFCISISVASTEAQQIKSTITDGKVQVQTIEVIKYKDTDVASKVISQSDRNIAVIQTSAPNPLVRAYRSTNPFPPVELNKVAEGEFILIGPEGSKWTVEILSVNADSGWWTEYLEVIIKGKSDEPDDPFNPGEPDDPVPPPQGDYSALTKMVAEFGTVWITDRENPDNSYWGGTPVVEADKTTASNLITEFSTIDFSSSTLEEAITSVATAREKVFLDRQNFKTEWNPLWSAIDRYFNQINPTNTEQYSQLIQAVIKGLQK